MAAPRRARIYDRLEGAEELPRAARRFAEVDGVAQSTRPGALQAGEGASLWAAMQRA